MNFALSYIYNNKMLYLRKTHQLGIRPFAVRLLYGGSCNYSNDRDSSDDEKQEQKTQKPLSNQETNNEESALNKLNRLLASMKTADNHINFDKCTDVVVKPGEANRKKKLEKKNEQESKDIFAAAQKVASLLGNVEQQQQTESELLTRLLGGKTSKSSSDQHTIPSNEGNISLSELIVGMKIDRGQQSDPTITRSEYVRRNIAEGKFNRQQVSNNQRRPIERKRVTEMYTGSVNLTGGEPLGIFTDPSVLMDSADLLPTWSYLHDQALQVQVSHPPSNYFDKIAKWTEQGKVWRFPIDNEQDWLDEKDVDFSEHIFLDQYLEDWCPNRGPIRHFMELVCVGLSKNPYITAKEKKDHIMWYKNYFESKKDILRDLMSKDPKVDKNIGDKQQKQVEA